MNISADVQSNALQFKEKKQLLLKWKISQHE